MSATDTRAKDCRHLIGGQWVDSAEGGRFDDLDPYTGDVVASVAAGGREDARRAIEAAHEAFAVWSQAGPGQRQAVFLKAADVLESRRDEVVEWLAKETGCSFGFGMFQMGFVPGLFRQAAGAAYAPLGQVIPSDMPGAFAMGVRRPVGVVGAISPWNAALILSARAIAAPLVFGNTVVLSPSEESPYVGGLLWGEIFAEAGLPDGVLNIVTHDRAGAPGDRRRAGREPARAADQLHRLDRHRPQAGRGRRPQPQARRARARRPEPADRAGRRRSRPTRSTPPPSAPTCTRARSACRRGASSSSGRSPSEFTSALAAKVAGLGVGDPREHTTIIGPLINAAALETVSRRVDEVVKAGAKVLAGGGAEGACYRATLLTDVPRDSEFAQVETFGPVASIEVVESADEAVASANATSYGLASGIITTDRDKGLAMAAQLEAGIVHVNDQPVHDEPQMPFGGVKDSGWGRFGGTFAMDEFTDLQWVTVQSGTRPFPF